MLLNPIEFYTELGEKCGKARCLRDEATAQFHKRHFTQALALEVDTHKEQAQQAFHDAYSVACEQYRRRV